MSQPNLGGNLLRRLLTSIRPRQESDDQSVRRPKSTYLLARTARYRWGLRGGVLTIRIGQVDAHSSCGRAIRYHDFSILVRSFVLRDIVSSLFSFRMSDIDSRLKQLLLVSIVDSQCLDLGPSLQHRQTEPHEVGVDFTTSAILHLSRNLLSAQSIVFC